MNNFQKQRFSSRVIKTLFNTITNKRICVLGFAYKKDTGDTRESASIDVIKSFLSENAHVHIYDPKVSAARIRADIVDPHISHAKCNS